MANERQRQELNPGLLPLAQYSLPSPVPPQHKCLTPARGACEEGRFQGSHLGWQELTKELTVLQPQSLKVGLLGTEGDYGLLSHPVMLHQRLTRSWPVALGPSTQWAEQNMSCAVFLRLCQCLPARDHQKHTRTKLALLLVATREETEGPN